MNSRLPQIKLLLEEQLSLEPYCDHAKDPMNPLGAPMEDLGGPMGLHGGSEDAHHGPNDTEEGTQRLQKA